MKKLQTLTTSTAIALASVGGTAFAQEAQATSVPTDTAVNEPALVAKSQVKPVEKTEVPAPSTVKPALDAQKAVVKEKRNTPIGRGNEISGCNNCSYIVVY